MNQNTNIIDVNESDFNEKIIEDSQKQLVIVDFWAPWCGPCKQLTPILEKIITSSDGKVLLAKINIDENQQIAAQLRIQSIPTVYAFKDKQIVNAFQGVLPESKVIEFIEKCLGSKLKKDNTEFYELMEKNISEKKYEEAKESLLEFISSNSEEVRAIRLYLDCLVELKDFDECKNFLKSLEKEVLEKEEIKQINKKLEIIEKNSKGPDINELLQKLENKKDDINLILEISDKYFSMQEYENAMNLLLSNYKKNKNMVKEKMVEFFNVLGDTNEHTISYRKKLSQLMFS